MLEKLEAIRARFEELGVALSNPEIVGDNSKYKQLSKEYRGLEKIVTVRNQYAKVLDDIDFTRQMLNSDDQELCKICSNRSRNLSVICVVESIKDVIAIESTQQFNGLYHVLGGIISPLDGIGPDMLQIDSLLARIKEEETEELIFALSPNIQGDTTIYYISKRLKDVPLKITTIARGIAFGGELEYADEMTLARSISNRITVDNYISNNF